MVLPRPTISEGVGFQKLFVIKSLTQIWVRLGRVGWSDFTTHSLLVLP